MSGASTISAWHVVLGLIIIGLIGSAALLLWFDSWLRLRRAEFIRTCEWPPGLLQKLEEQYPGLDRKDSALVSRGLRQFFIGYLMSGKLFVSMPSRVADDLWNEFILYTRVYQRFCRRAFGSFMHPRRRPCLVKIAGVMEVCAACGDTAANTRT